MENLSVKIEDRGRAYRDMQFSKAVITIGRSTSCDIRVAANEVSSRHARLKIYSDYIVVEDLNSSNGTFVDGVRVRGTAEVGKGSVIELGHGGPRIEITGGVAQVLQSLAGTDTPRASSASKSHQRLLIAALCVAVVTLFAFGLLSATGLSVFWYARRAGSVVHSISDTERLKQAVGLVIVGYESNETAPRFGAYSTGTAFAITSDGFLITNKHVIDGVQNNAISTAVNALIQKLEAKYNVALPSAAKARVWVAFDGDLYDAKICHISAEHDMSVLKVDRVNMPYFRLSSRDNLPNLMNLYIFGFPGAASIALSDDEEMEESNRQKLFQSNIKSRFKKRDFTFSATSGTLTKISPEADGQRWIQHNATMSHGNSGGPLCIEDGTVVGINTLGHAKEAGVYWSLMVDQLRREIEPITSNVQWAR